MAKNEFITTDRKLTYHLYCDYFNMWITGHSYTKGKSFCIDFLVTILN